MKYQDTIWPLHKNYDLMLNVARIFRSGFSSVMTLQQADCVRGAPTAARAAQQVHRLHPQPVEGVPRKNGKESAGLIRKSMVLRLCFVLGNLSGSNVAARDAIVEQYNGVETLANLFRMYVEKDSKLMDGDQERPPIEEVMVKVNRKLRGAKLAAHPRARQCFHQREHRNSDLQATGG